MTTEQSLIEKRDYVLIAQHEHSKGTWSTGTYVDMQLHVKSQSGGKDVCVSYLFGEPEAHDRMEIWALLGYVLYSEPKWSLEPRRNEYRPMLVLYFRIDNVLW